MQHYQKVDPEHTVIAVGMNKYSSKERYYGYGKDALEADEMLCLTTVGLNYIGIYQANVLNNTYVPVPPKWRKTWGLCWIYWFFHWLAVNWVALTKFHRLYPFHDLDKPLKLTFGWSYSKIKKEHSRKAKHHPNGKLPEEVNWTEAVCDWEAAAFSKPNSKLNALGTMIEYYSEYKNYIIPILDKGGLI